MILRLNIKLFSHLKATMLPYCFTASSGIFMVAINLDLLVQELIVLNFKRIKYFSKRFHVCRLRIVEDWKRQTSCYEGNFIAAPHQVTLREKNFFPDHFLSCFRVFFFRFRFLVYLDDYCTSTGFDSFEPFKKYEPGHPT